MWQGRTNQIAKIWGTIGGGQIDAIQSGVTVQGDPPRADGYVFIRFPRAGYTKRIWLSSYTEIVVAPPPPPPPPPDGTTVLTHTIDIFNDGSIKVDGNSVP